MIASTFAVIFLVLLFLLWHLIAIWKHFRQVYETLVHQKEMIQELQLKVKRQEEYDNRTHL